MNDLQLSGTAFLGTVSFPWSGDSKANLTFHLGDYGCSVKNAQAILEIVGAIQTAMPRPVQTNLKEAARARATESPVQVTPVTFETAPPPAPVVEPTTEPVLVLDAPPAPPVQLDLGSDPVAPPRVRGRKAASDPGLKADGTPKKKPGRKPKNAE